MIMLCHIFPQNLFYKYIKLMNLGFQLLPIENKDSVLKFIKQHTIIYARYNDEWNLYKILNKDIKLMIDKILIFS